MRHTSQFTTPPQPPFLTPPTLSCFILMATRRGGCFHPHSTLGKRRPGEVKGRASRKELTHGDSWGQPREPTQRGSVLSLLTPRPPRCLQYEPLGREWRWGRSESAPAPEQPTSCHAGSPLPNRSPTEAHSPAPGQVLPGALPVS